MLALGSVDIYLYSPSEHFQIDQVPSILDKILNKVILGQTQLYYNNVHDKFIQWRTLKTIFTLQYSFSEDPSLMNALSCFSSRFMVWCNYQWSKNISVEVWMITTLLNYAFIWIELLRAIFDSASSWWCVCRLCRWVNRVYVWWLQLSNCM